MISATETYQFVKPKTWVGHNDIEFESPLVHRDSVCDIVKFAVLNSPACAIVAASVSTRQSATETPEQFVRRLTLAVLDEMGGAK